jgi:chemosensory pili system protein ChpA (sensor histidine kinase/response regulator)
MSDFLASQEVDLAELQLQQELRSMFDIDAQNYLQSYIDIVERLQPESWTADIQEMYRCVHTIKGGAVTVGADAILSVSALLEEILSDLRYLQTSPPLEDNQLSQMLFEAGELMTASLQVQQTGASARSFVEPSLARLNALRQTIQQSYLAEFNERTQLFQDFAEQGFDLVILDLDMAIEQLPDTGKVPGSTLQIAKETLKQLIQIGKDLEFEKGWLELLQKSKQFLTRLEAEFWRAEFPGFLKELKDCSRVGGVVKAKVSDVSPREAEEQGSRGAEEVSKTAQPNQAAQDAAANVQIPVPLERLNLSAQHLVETLLSARSCQGYNQTLQNQLAQLSTLAKDILGNIGQLRQLQNDYALLEDLQENNNRNSEGPKLETYRRGYTIINRLLESSLRISELGDEAAIASRQTTESISLLDRNLLNLQRTVEDSRLVPFSKLIFRARAILRDLTTRYSKPVQLIVQGEKLQLDVGTIQNLEPVLLHLLRNCFDHGLESPEERTAKGKPAQGTIVLSLRRQGNFYQLNMQDDGRGIDGQVIQRIAKEKGMPLTKTDTPAEILAVICQPGFSSKSEVSDISGRGVGMDVVASQINNLGGQLILDTVVGKGSNFQIRLPVPHLLVRCILVRVGENKFAIPTEEVLTTTIWDNLSEHKIMRSGSIFSFLIERDGVSLPALDLLEYWRKGATRELPDTAICLRIRSSTLTAAQQKKEIWLLADDLIEQLDLLINPIPNPLTAPVGLMGVSLQNDGSLIPVIEPATLGEKLWTGLADEVEVSGYDTYIGSNYVTYFEEPDETEDSGFATQTILVVDDAALIRRRLEVSLTNNGYTVYTCRDGLEAWNWLQNNSTPAMMITDIEMPMMDGFTLISKCRESGINIPIMVSSSRLSEEWGKEARRVGATDYLTKGFTTPELLEKVKMYINQ